MNNAAVIILNFNNYGETIRCAKNLITTNENFHIIVVDNCSTNNSYEELQKELSRETCVDVVQTKENGGYSYGNNYGIRYAIEKYAVDYICIMNPDVVTNCRVINELCNDLAKSDEYAFSSGLMSIYDTIYFDRVSFDINSAKNICDDLFLLKRSRDTVSQGYKITNDGLIIAPALPGSFFVCDAEKFRKIGFFDESLFLYCEEIVLGIRCNQVGFKCIIDPSIIYRHNHHSENQSRQQIYRNYKYSFNKILAENRIKFNSRAYVLRKYFSGKYYKRLVCIYHFNKILLYGKHIMSLFISR